MCGNQEGDFVDEAEPAADPRLADLVAYLDGELDDSDSTRLEHQLSSDAPLRQYADTLDRTWQMLDSLGESTASGEFTRKTLSSIRTIPLSDSASTENAVSWIQSLRSIPIVRIGVWAAFGFVGCAAGMLLSRHAAPQDSASADVRMLERLDLLREYEKVYSIPSADFLRQVSQLQTMTEKGERAP